MSHSPNGALEYNRTCDVCWRRLTTLDDICETCEDNISGKIQEYNHKENNMNNNNNNDHGGWAHLELTEMKRQLEEQRRANEEYRSDVRSNVARIQEVLHNHARDCDDQALIDMLIDTINLATRNGFPEISNCTRTFELTLTYVVEVQALSEEDARDNFIDGEYDSLIELSDYYELDVEEGC